MNASDLRELIDETYLVDAEFGTSETMSDEWVDRGAVYVTEGGAYIGEASNLRARFAVLAEFLTPPPYVYVIYEDDPTRRRVMVSRLRAVFCGLDRTVRLYD